jgi:hypothetical protein
MKKNKENKDQFLIEYKEIFESNNLPNQVKQEWGKKGDVFQKFTMYNLNFKLIPNLDSIGSTTLISDLK